MFDLVHKHKRAVQVVLALITLPFAFFGVDYYFHRGDTMPEVARVGDLKVTRVEYDEALREQQDQMRQRLGANYDPAVMENPEVRFALLQQLVNQKLLAQKARKDAVRVSDAQLQQVIASMPAFQEDGKFSPDKYRQLLAGQNISPLGFEQRVRDELALAPFSDPIAMGGIVAVASQQRYLGLLEQQREVAIATIPLEPFVKDIKVDDAGVKAFFDANAQAFQTPEQARFEYVVLTPDAIMSQVSVDPAEVKQQYDKNSNQYGQPEERSAAHILIPVKPDAKPEEREAARKKAEDLAKQARAAPAKFGELAKENSKDPGSAPQGGDLGVFARGTMVKAFDDAVFAMKVGDISDPVATEFGYHVIKLNGINAAKIRPFEEVRPQIEADMKRQKSSSKFASAADQFQNLVYEQADSLQGVAKALNLTIQTSPLVGRAQAQALAMGSAKFVDALFSPESIQSKRNTEATEVGPNTLMAGRIVEYKPAAPIAFDQVKETIRQQLVRRGASEAAQRAGNAKLAELNAGKSEQSVGLTFGAPVRLERTRGAPGISPEGMKRIYQADPLKLPRYIGAPGEQGGYAIYKLTQVVTPVTNDQTKLESAGGRINEQVARELFSAYLASLKSKTEVKINQANLEKR